MGEADDPKPRWNRAGHHLCPSSKDYRLYPVWAKELGSVRLTAVRPLVTDNATGHCVLERFEIDVRQAPVAVCVELVE